MIIICLMFIIWYRLTNSTFLVISCCIFCAFYTTLFSDCQISKNVTRPYCSDCFGHWAALKKSLKYRMVWVGNDH